MAAREGYSNNLPTKFLRINSNGALFESSKDPRDGFKEHFNKNGTVSYWKEYYNGVDGYLFYLDTKESTYDGITQTNFLIGVRDDVEIVFISFPFNSKSGGLNQYVKSFLKYFENIDLDKKILINTAKKKSGEDFAPGNFFISQFDGNDYTPIKSYYSRNNNNLPPARESMNFDGTKKFDFSEQDGFLFDKFKQYKQTVKNNNPNQSNDNSNSNQQPDNNNQTQSDYKNTGYSAYSNNQSYMSDVDDLPF